MTDNHQLTQTGGWVPAEILKYETPQLRAHTIMQFIRICKVRTINMLLNNISNTTPKTQCCKKMNSFNSVFAIIGGLNHATISRLKLTWEVNINIMRIMNPGNQ